jgi:hypothetical protein
VKQLIEDIRRLSSTWEIWAILGFITLIVVGFNAVINRQHSLKGVETNIRGIQDTMERMERHLEVIDHRDERSINDRHDIHQAIEEIKKGMP